MDKIQQHQSEFELYYSLLAEWNEKFNLTAVTDRAEVFTRHFADSIAAADYIPQNANVCDIGSGAGFPGLPLKIVRPDLSVTLFDSVNKKITFLNEVISRLGLNSTLHTPHSTLKKHSALTAVHIRAEDAGHSAACRERFDVAVARAVAPLPILCEYALPLIKTGGLFIAYKTQAAAADETASAQNALKILNGTVKITAPYVLNDIPLALIIIEKTAPVPSKYPRNGNKPRLQPL